MPTNQNNWTEKLTIINRWYSEQVADLITNLKGIPEGAGIGDNHSHTRIPLTIVGATQGYFNERNIE
jgi:hypothetical protein